jgi:hypothetical protein
MNTENETDKIEMVNIHDFAQWLEDESGYWIGEYMIEKYLNQREDD